MGKIVIKLTIIFGCLCLIGSGIVYYFVHQWSMQAEGQLPPKTAVILHAVNHNLVHLDIKLPDFIKNKNTPAAITKEDKMIPMQDGNEIPVRIYKPVGEGPFPIVLYYHGGAFLKGYGNIDTHDNITRYLTAKTKSVVVSVGYRVAPEHVFPTATEDSYAAFLWAVQHAESLNGDPTKVAVAGDSAGGNIATVVAHMARDRQGPDISAQLLYYPLTTFRAYQFDSREKYDSGYYFLSKYVMEKARSLYTPEESMWESPYTSPLDARSLAGLPPTFIITAEFDPLRDEGEAYAHKLAASGVPVEAYRYQGVMHAFVSFYEVMYQGKHGLDQSASFLTRAMNEGIEADSYTLKLVEVGNSRENIQDHLEAYAFAGGLLGKQVFSIIVAGITKVIS